MSNWSKEEVEALKSSKGGGNANNMKRYFSTLPVSSSMWPKPSTKEGERKDFIVSAYCDKSWYTDSPTAEMPIESSPPSVLKAATMPASMPFGESDPFSEFQSATVEPILTPSAADGPSRKLDDTPWAAFDTASNMAFETVPPSPTLNPNLATILDMFDVSVEAPPRPPPAQQCYSAPAAMSNGICKNPTMPAGAAAMPPMNTGYGMGGMGCMANMSGGIPSAGIGGGMPMGSMVGGIPMGDIRGGMSMGGLGEGMPMGGIAMPPTMPMGVMCTSMSVGTGMRSGDSMAAGIGGGVGSTVGVGVPTTPMGAGSGMPLTSWTGGNVRSAPLELEFTSKVDEAAHSKPMAATPDPFESLLGGFTDLKVRKTLLSAH